jgi:hypothetical protein
MLANAKSLYADSKGIANTTVKQEEDLSARSLTVSERDRAVVENERDLQVHREAVDTSLERKLKGVASHEASLHTHEATLAEEQKKLEMTQLTVSNHELAADIRHARLDTREAELVDRERRLAEAELQELAAARQRLEELHAAQSSEAQKVWDFLGQTEAALVPLGFSPIHPVGRVGEVTTALPLLDSVGVKMS